MCQGRRGPKPLTERERKELGVIRSTRGRGEIEAEMEHLLLTGDSFQINEFKLVSHQWLQKDFGPPGPLIRLWAGSHSVVLVRRECRNSLLYATSPQLQPSHTRPCTAASTHCPPPRPLPPSLPPPLSPAFSMRHHSLPRPRQSAMS